MSRLPPPASPGAGSSDSDRPSPAEQGGEPPLSGDLSRAESERFDDLASRAADFLRRAARKSMSRSVQRRGDEDDVLQDTMTSVLQAIVRSHRHLLDDEHQFRRYCLTVLQNHVKDLRVHHERQRRDMRRELSLDAPGSLAVDPSAPSTRSPSRTAAREEAARAINRRVDGLDDIDRSIVLSRAVDDRSYPEIGRAVGLSSEATRKRFTRVFAWVAAPFVRMRRREH